MRMENNISDELLKEISSRMGGIEPRNPIGKCFDTAMLQMLFGGDPPEDLRLVHAIGVAKMPGIEGKEIAHAWLEWKMDSKLVAYDTTWGILQEAEFYRSNLKVSYYVEYAIDEVIELVRKTDNAGPWDVNILRVLGIKEET